MCPSYYYFHNRILDRETSESLKGMQNIFSSTLIEFTEI